VTAGSHRFFIDRGIGGKIVPDGLRERGWQVVTMNERYGQAVAENMDDPDWIAEATEHGEVCLCKDAAIARKPVEAAAVRAARARVFALTNANISGPMMLEWIVRNEARILRRAGKPGPYVHGIYADDVRPLPLRKY
jgi:hypothetical protein